MANRIILWVIILVIGIGLIVFAQVFRDKPSNISVNSPSSQSPSPISSPTQSPTPINSQTSCKISGSIRFISNNLYETMGAKISYQNVDDKIRQIFWTSSPDDGVLSIGPNLFEQLPLPSGEKEVGLALNKNPLAGSYTLTAAVSYGVKLQNGGAEEKKVSCTGTITVDTSKI